ncbi:MAG: YifB family Mg chelatase-like AAA ATPase, partial [Pseudoxanthomonas sp.]
MSLALVHSRARAGVHAPAVRVEVHLSGGLPATHIVGLPEAAVREARDRVRAALLCAQFEFPARRITVNLAPADLPKDGGRFDLPIALGILAASGQIDRQALAAWEFLGELALTGELRAVDGVLPAVLAARADGRRLMVPSGSAAEAALPGEGHAAAARTLLEVCAVLAGRREAEPARAPGFVPPPVPDLADVRGQLQARRALEVAAAGGHHLLLVGSPGCGKTLLASRLPGILPEASEAEALETAAIASVSGRGLEPARWRQRPFRSPHHTASAMALVGGGTLPRPGEISLAHHGVLFLDELPEWSRAALEVLRQPLESGTVTVSRAARSMEFPARFQLVAAMNPCPCGWAGDPCGRCHCSRDAIARYRSRISGPLLDRIDLQVEVPRLPPAALRPDAP